MPLFRALVTETAATRRWYTVRASNPSEAKSKLNVGDTVEEQDVLGSVEVVCRVVEYSTVERVLSKPSQKPRPIIPESTAQPELCDCQLPGTFCSGVPGILAQVENCHLVPGGKVERCDLCQRYASDQAAHDRLVELGMARSLTPTL